jgi:hypothetical protein
MCCLHSRTLSERKIAAFWQNDDAGKDQMKGTREGIGDKANMIVADASYEVTDPTPDSRSSRLQNSSADIFISWATPKAAAQALKKGRGARLEVYLLHRKYIQSSRGAISAGSR